MLHHENYRNFCQKHFSRLINHDDTIPEEKLKEYVEKTDLAWKERSKRHELVTPSKIPEYSKLPTLSIVNPVIVEEKPGIKTKFKHLLSLKKKKTIGPSTSFAIMGARPVKATIIEKVNDNMFGVDYQPGSYTSSHPYKSRLSGLPSPNVQEGEKEGSQKDENCDKENEELSYEKEKISFHDRSKTGLAYLKSHKLTFMFIGDIKEFITLKNSDSILDSKFSNAKASKYGFIGYAYMKKRKNNAKR